MSNIGAGTLLFQYSSRMKQVSVKLIVHPAKQKHSLLLLMIYYYVLVNLTWGHFVLFQRKSASLALGFSRYN